MFYIVDLEINMDELLRQMIAQSPAVAVLIFMVYKLDQRLQEVIAMIIDLCKQEQAIAHDRTIKK